MYISLFILLTPSLLCPHLHPLPWLFFPFQCCFFASFVTFLMSMLTLSLAISPSNSIEFIFAFFTCHILELQLDRAHVYNIIALTP
ncbi:hypothetical protein EV361DRAFT_278094 [Lentinula raphanica]|nr:hypothetical protein EV361DRAFT_278094 [Lentinula raphanica]